MKGKLLQALKTKFPGVEDAILDRIAEKKASGLTDENLIPSIVEGVSFQDVLTSYGDFRANGATISAVQNYEKKHGLKDGKPLEEETKPAETDDMAAVIAEAIAKANAPLIERLNAFEGERKAAERSALISAKAKEYGVPDALASMLKIPEDADLDSFFKDSKQTFANLGFQSVVPPAKSKEQMEEKNASDLAAMIDKGTQEIIKNK